jgi:preprotein translocase subunit SecG
VEYLTFQRTKGIIGVLNHPFRLPHLEDVLKAYIDIALIITSIALVASIVLQSKGAGLGGLTGMDTGGVFAARRGLEKTLFRVTIVLSVIFFVLATLSVLVWTPTL